MNNTPKNTTYQQISLGLLPNLMMQSSSRSRSISRSYFKRSAIYLSVNLCLTSLLAACSGNVEVSQTPAPTPTPTVTATSAPIDQEKVWDQFDKEEANKLTGLAHLLAGQSLDGTPFEDVQNSSLWQGYADRLNSAWTQLETQQLSKLDAWKSTNLAKIPANSSVLYPFSGPDFLYSSRFFPNAPVYVMVGLEPLGSLPDVKTLSAEDQTKLYQWSEQSLSALLEYSFFRTKAMQKDLKDWGTLPILFLFAARNGYDILDVNYVALSDEGQVKKLEAGNPNNLIAGVKIDLLAKNSDQPQTLYYFSLDLSDGSLESKPGFAKFLERFDKPVTYIKAASYLMHNEYFSFIRDQILNRSQYVLQDDSGIPLRFFDEANWTRLFFGRYKAPIDLFKERFQADLKAAYESGKNVAPLTFGIGYKYYDDANLILAERKGEPPLRGREPKVADELEALKNVEDLDRDADLKGKGETGEDGEGKGSPKAAPERLPQDEAEGKGDLIPERREREDEALDEGKSELDPRDRPEEAEIDNFDNTEEGAINVPQDEAVEENLEAEPEAEGTENSGENPDANPDANSGENEDDNRVPPPPGV